jgi:hypothetical protein
MKHQLWQWQGGRPMAFGLMVGIEHFGVPDLLALRAINRSEHCPWLGAKHLGDFVPLLEYA